MARVRAIFLSPVKSLGLMQAERTAVTPHGIPGDRAFVVLDDRDEVATLRRYGALAHARTRFDVERNELTMLLPGGREVAGTVGDDREHEVLMFGRPLRGVIVDGPWAAELSALTGIPMRLMRALGGPAQDSHAMSMLSLGSVEQLSSRANLAQPLDPRRFRNSLLIEGTDPHEEDSWIGRDVRAGTAVLRVAERDQRCSLITKNPDSGERDLDTLRVLASYRRQDDGEVCFGVYADVVEPGDVAVGDPVQLV
ncbi:MAG TPA: MOSC domain-containing protein [Gaiellales bacterium]|nr:MOSC domain-containing protein [Gaiellales bacterium]